MTALPSAPHLDLTRSDTARLLSTGQSSFLNGLTIGPDSPLPPTAIGLIAGGGGLPILIAKSLRQAGYPVHGLGLSRQYDLELPGLCSSFREVGLLRVGSWGRILNKMGVHHAIMVGKVDKAKLMHDPLRMVRNIPDWAAVRGWYKTLRRDRRSHALLSFVTDELRGFGVHLLDTTMPIQDEMASVGVMTSTVPTADQRGDIEFGWPLLAHTMQLDIGQVIAVRERDILAVEAVEGTDRMIERVGQVCRRRGWTLLKAARVGHDRRSDVPTVGINTVRNLHAAGGTCLALAAGDVIMLDKQEMIDLADKLGMSIVGVPVGFAKASKGAPVAVPSVLSEVKPNAIAEQHATHLS